MRARREGGPFKDLFDFCERIDHKVVPRAALEKLIKAGGFDCFGARRAQLMHVLTRALQAASEMQQDRRAGQGNLFDAFAGGAAEPTRSAEALPDIPEWPDSEKLKNEKEALDFYFSSHPLAQHEAALRRYATHTVDQLSEVGLNQEVILGGMLTQIRLMNTKKARNGNSRYVRCKLEDFTGAVECVMWPDDFVRFKDDFREDHICYVKGAVERTREEPGLILSRVFSIEQAQRELTRCLRLSLHVDNHGPNEIDALARVLKRAPGNCPVYLDLSDRAGKRCRLKLGESFRINPAALATSDLEMILGTGHVEFYGQLNGNSRGGK